MPRIRSALVRLAVFATVFAAITTGVPAEEPDSDTTAATYALKKDQIGYYEGILRKSVHTSRLDVFGAVNAAGVPTETHLAGGVLLRLFAPRPLLGDQIIRDYRLYRETAWQTGHRLSPEAEGRVEELVAAVREYQRRPLWERTVVVVGANLPYDPIAAATVDTRVFAAVGLELDDRIALSVGSTLYEDPQLVVSLGFGLGSTFYAAGYATLERMERALTHRRIYQTVDQTSTAPRAPASGQ